MNERTRLLVTGARAWSNELVLNKVLNHALSRLTGEVILVSGHCPSGADRMAERWAADCFVPIDVEAHPADWDRYGSAAGFRRNAEMVELGADLVVGFLAGESRGTRHTLKLAREAGLPLLVVKDMGDGTFRWNG